MADLVAQKPNLLQQLPARKEADERIFAVVRESIARAYADTRYAVPSPEEQQRMVEETAKDIKRYASTIRVEEIPEAIRDGVRGVHGDYAGLSVATFVRFCVYHVQSQKRRDLIRSLQQDRDGTTPPTPEEMDARWMEHLGKAFETVESGDQYDDYGNGLYDWLDEKGKIVFTKERKWEFVEQARQQLAAEKEAEKANSDYFKRKHLATIIESIQNEGTIPMVSIRAKKIALNTWIRECIEMEITPEQILEND